MKRILNDILRGGVSRRNERGRDAKSHASTTSTVIVFLTVLLMALSSSFNASAINVSLVPPSGTGTGAVDINAVYGYTVAPVVSFTIVNNDQAAGTGKFHVVLRDGQSADYEFTLNNGQTWIKGGGDAVEITDLAAAGQLTLKVRPKLGFNATTGNAYYATLVQLQDANKQDLSGISKEIQFKVKPKEITIPDGAITADKQYNNNKDIYFAQIKFPALSAQYGIVSDDVGKVSLILSSNTNVTGRTSVDVGTQLVDYSSIILTGAAAGNYTLKTPVKIAATITPRVIEIKADSITATREYDGTNIITSDKIASLSTINGNNGGIDDSYIVPGVGNGGKNYDGGNLVLELESGSQGSLSSPNVTASAENVTFSPGFKLTGSKKDNYKLTQPEVAVTITKKDISYATAATVKKKTYDKTTTGELESIDFTGIVSGETLVAGTDYDATVTFTADANAGENKSVKISSIALKNTDKANNYNLTSTSDIDITTGIIEKKEVTVTGVTATKDYDGSPDFTATQINATSIALDGNIDAGNLSLDASNASGSLPKAAVVTDAENGTFEGFELSGSAAGNYSLKSVAVKASITQAAALTATDLKSNLSTLSTGYDGKEHKVVVELATSNGDNDALKDATVYYNGEATVPKDAGMYTVTVDIAAGNYAAATGLSLGNFTISKVNPDNSYLNYSNYGDKYSGNSLGVTDTDISLKTDYSGLGEISNIQYESTDGTTYPLSTKAPVNVGTYKYYVDIAAGDNFNAANKVELGTVAITKNDAPLNSLDYVSSDDISKSIPYDGKSHGVTIKPKEGIEGMGDITVYYKSTYYDGKTDVYQTAPPVNAGTYGIYVLIDEEGDNFTKLNDGKITSFNNLTIKISGITADDLEFEEETKVTYNGSPQGVVVTTKLADRGVVTPVYVNSSNGNWTYNPVDAGTYYVLADISKSYYSGLQPIYGLPLGGAKLIIEKATPTSDDLVYDRGLDSLLHQHYYSGYPIEFSLPLAALRSGLGTISAVKFNGSTRLPVDLGTYAVTVDVAGNGYNYTAAKDLLLGYVVIADGATPVIQREVTLNVSGHFTSDPAPGRSPFYVRSGNDLVITLTPRTSLPEGYVPQVTTDRTIYPDSNDGGVSVTLNDDGTYTVVIAYIIEAMTVTIEAVASPESVGSEVVSDAARVWSSGGQLTIAAGSDSGQASIYAVSGVLVKTVPYAAGETVRTALPTGIYVAVAGNRVFKVVINN